MQRAALVLANMGKLTTIFNQNRNNSKQALTNDLIEGLETDLEKLKRFEENIKIRKMLTQKGDKELVDETEKDRERIRQNNLFDEVVA